MSTNVAHSCQARVQIDKEFAPAAYAQNVGTQDMVLTDLIAREVRDMQRSTRDTLSPPPETLTLIDVKTVAVETIHGQSDD